jgi:hypothetical protein
MATVEHRHRFHNFCVLRQRSPAPPIPVGAVSGSIQADELPIHIDFITGGDIPAISTPPINGSLNVLSTLSLCSAMELSS